MRGDRLHTAALALAILGLVIAAYLTYVHYSGVTALCEIAHGCEQVQTSRWAKLAGVPVSLLGLIGYVAIVAALLLRGEAARIAATAFAVGGSFFSAYLTYREIWTIEAICIWCIASAIIMTALAVLTATRMVRYPT